MYQGLSICVRMLLAYPVHLRFLITCRRTMMLSNNLDVAIEFNNNSSFAHDSMDADADADVLVARLYN